MSEDLKPCPFCGGEARMYYSGVDNDWVATCNHCEIWFDGVSKEIVDKYWNTRASDPIRSAALARNKELETAGKIAHNAMTTALKDMAHAGIPSGQIGAASTILWRALYHSPVGTMSEQGPGAPDLEGDEASNVCRTCVHWVFTPCNADYQGPQPGTCQIRRPADGIYKLKYEDNTCKEHAPEGDEG